MIIADGTMLEPGDLIKIESPFYHCLMKTDSSSHPKAFSGAEYVKEFIGLYLGLNNTTVKVYTSFGMRYFVLASFEIKKLS